MLTADLFRSGRWHPVNETFGLVFISVENVTTTTITVRWRMSGPCTGQLEYGLTTAYGSTTTAETSLTFTEHSQTITGLSAGLTYHIRTKSTSAASVTVYSVDQSVTTVGAPVVTLRGPRPAPAIPTGSNVYTIPSSISNAGVGDVGAAISSWLDGLPAGSTAVFDRAGTGEGFQHGVGTPANIYRMGNAGISWSRNDLTLWGYNCRLLSFGNGAHQASPLRFWADGDAHIRGFEVYGPNTNGGTSSAYSGAPGEFSAGVNWAGNGTVDVLDCWIHHVWGDGIFQAGWSDVDHTPTGYEWAYNLVELNGRMGMTANQNDSGTAWLHHNIIRDIALYLIDGEDQRLGTDTLLNVLIEENDFGTYAWDLAYNPRGVSFVYSFPSFGPLPNVAEVGPVTIRNNSFLGGASTAAHAKFGSNHGVIDQQGVDPADGDYHDFSVTTNDFSGIPAAQKTVAYWARMPNLRTVTMTGNTGLTTMAARYTTTGSSGVTVSGNT